jgi:methylmalonyl-CoA mutase N-terminal domain/subunit
VGKQQRDRVEAVKKKRDDAAVKDALAVLDKAARGEENVMPPILAAVRDYATLGEISDCLRGVFGEYTAKTDV